MNKEKLFTLINLLSLSRVAWAILTVMFLDSWLKFLFLGIGIASDFFDGFLSRKLKLTSKSGAMIDGATDKIFFVVIFLGLFLKLELPWYYILLVFNRDIWVAVVGLALLIFKAKGDYEIKARWSGKIVTIFQFGFLAMLLFEFSKYYEITVWIIFVLSIWSVIDYGYYFYHHTFLRPKK